MDSGKYAEGSRPMKFETRTVHAGQGPDPAFGAVMQPIYQVSTFAYQGVGQMGTYDYSRSGNPTRRALEDCLASLEGGTRGFAFGTGMAAEATALALLSAGDHVIIHDDLYGGTYRLLTSIVVRHGVEVQFVNLRDLDALRAAIRDTTRLIWTESPTNPLMNILDLAAIGAIGRSAGVLTLCDNTFLSPFFQNPLALGMDLVLHSTTKYINGHSDVVGGAIVVGDDELAERVYFHQNAMGSCQAPHDCFLVLRGLKTLALRMAAHNSNALAIARFLERHSAIEQVRHPGLESHPQHALALRQSRGFGGTFSFTVKGGQDEAYRFLGRLKLFILAESLGGVESLIEHPWTMTHLSMPEEARAAAGISRNLVRISVGIEHADDLIADLSQALDAI